jgi:hypothetical protein
MGLFPCDKSSFKPANTGVSHPSEREQMKFAFKKKICGYTVVICFK